MYRFLTRPIWILFAVIVAAATYTFMSLGFWQLERMSERRIDNVITLQRQSSPPVQLDVMVSPGDDSATSGQDVAFLTATVTGTYDISNQVLARSQTNNGIAGFHVVTPFVDDSGTGLLVNQGWVPLDNDTPPVTQDESLQTITVVLQPTQIRRGFGPEEADGPLVRIARIDIDRLEQQMPYGLYPVYGILVDQTETSPIPITLPELSSGPHLSYAIQWFSFAAVSVIGFWLLARSRARQGTSVTDHG